MSRLTVCTSSRERLRRVVRSKHRNITSIVATARLAMILDERLLPLPDGEDIASGWPIFVEDEEAI